MTLSDATSRTRQILKWLAIIFGGLFLILIFFNLFNFLRNTFFPAPLPPPQISFGKLPAADFPQSSKAQQYSYFIDTIAGGLPSFLTQEKVFKMEERQPDLLALPKAKSLVTNVGFSKEPVKISENIYQWKDQKERTLTMNITDLNFNLISDFLSNPNQPLFSKDEDTAKDTADILLQGIGLKTADLDPNRTSAQLYSIKNYSIIPATSLSTAQAVQVSFFQTPINNLQIYYPKFSLSPINFLIGEVNGQPEVVEANYFYQKPSEASSTYPIKTTMQAYEDLEKGKAIIVREAQGSKVAIKNVTLGYYIAERKQPFLLPIMVFEGNDGFVAYVNAITDEWVNK